MAEEPVFRIDGIPVQVLEEGKTEEFCSRMRYRGCEVECNDWTEIKTRRNKKERKIEEVMYDAAEFKKAANKYYTAKPPDLVQTSEKLWLGAVYTVKEYFLKLHVLPNSHDSLRTLAKAAAFECDKTKAVTLTEAWRFAEDFHKYTYASINFEPNEFESQKQAVEEFIVEFPKIGEEAGSKAIEKMMMEDEREKYEKKIRFQPREGIIWLGEQEYHYENVAY
uniref:Uncharacterized protein n=1 Tax=Panagrolaimus sp. JU765 TaxID=591449 RepID=A0AC34R9Y2_9BILA